jgi:hypothetical protein
LAVPAEDLLGALADAVRDADRAIGEIAASTPTGEAVTTLTALLWSGSRLALVHIGDTRAYLVRDGELFQITHDDTYVQSLVDEGRLTAEEAASHPQRSLLVRALTGTGGAQPDLSLHEAVSRTTLIEPGGVATDFAERSMSVAPALNAYAEGPAGQLRQYVAVPAADNADATSDVDKVAAAIIASADIAPAPKRLALGNNAYAQIKAALTDRPSALDATKELSFSTDKTAQV